MWRLYVLMALVIYLLVGFIIGRKFASFVDKEGEEIFDMTDLIMFMWLWPYYLYVLIKKRDTDDNTI